MIDADTRRLGRIVRRLREKRKWSQGELADMVGMHRVSLVRLENGVDVAPAAKLRDLRSFALAFEIDPNELYRMVCREA